MGTNPTIVPTDGIIDIHLTHSYQDGYLFADGRMISNICQGDTVRVYKAETPTKIIQIEEHQFFETVRNKLLNRNYRRMHHRVPMKNRRQRRILEIVSNETIGTQKELAERLQQEGFETTQATISRDIKELLLVKVNIGGNRYKYVIAQDTPVTDAKLRMVLREFIISYDYSENLLILNTAPGNANTVASAIDRASWPQVIGSLAGDDTVMLVIKPASAVHEVVEKIEDYTMR